MPARTKVRCMDCKTEAPLLTILGFKPRLRNPRFLCPSCEERDRRIKARLLLHLNSKSYALDSNKEVRTCPLSSTES